VLSDPRTRKETVLASPRSREADKLNAIQATNDFEQTMLHRSEFFLRKNRLVDKPL